ncbi:energy transducer TonB [Alteromonas sp. a30]|uniref:energy transducer TonB n=1 Tax=Alteromonas sp. a30 TaxID=2730917 RepID=UPI00227EBDEB|nr:energy transducer TonB [Alteromonas sp. a30]MCY7296805.1 energy transducer TonB [Alteromonas sp. a30]
MKLLTLSVFSAALFTAPISYSETDKTQSLHLGTIKNAEVITRLPPKYPKSAAAQGKEGWVSLSYVIEPDGSVANVIVVDSSNEIFEKNAIASIKQWQYSPATQDGNPTQRCRNHVILDFRLEKGPKAASRQFVKRYRIANKHLKNGELAKAKAVRDEIENKGRWNAYEDMFFQMLNTLIAQQENDSLAELNAIEDILFHRELLKPDQIVAYVSRLFPLAIQNQQYGKIKWQFEKLVETQGDHPQIEKLRPYYDKVTALLESDTPFTVEGEIGERNYWYYRLNRRAFNISQINGALAKLEVRCDNKLSEFLVEEDSVWHVPASWGKCSVYLFGDQATQFTLTEIYDLPQTHTSV